MSLAPELNTGNIALAETISEAEIATNFVAHVVYFDIEYISRLVCHIGDYEKISFSVYDV